MSSAVGILGGMGPAAGSEFVKHFLSACEGILQSRGESITDQSYPEHWLAQIPLPDRTACLEGKGPSPFPGMARALENLAQVGVRTVAIACNTAHAWHAELRHAFPALSLLHVADETASQLHRSESRTVGLLATTATCSSGLYGAALRPYGIVCHTPLPEEQELVMRGIFEGVKAGRLSIAREMFNHVAARLAERHQLDALVLGCTEIPLALKELQGFDDVLLVDPAAALARALAVRAYQS